MKRILGILTLVSLTSCAQTDGGSIQDLFTKENIGAVTGAVGGAWLGSNVGKGKGNVAAIAAGTLLGGFAGKSIGASLDRADQAYHQQTYQTSLEYNHDGKPAMWQNPNNGHSGSITPVRTYPYNGTHCREFTQTISIGGHPEEAHGRACRMPDGTWKIQ